MRFQFTMQVFVKNVMVYAFCINSSKNHVATFYFFSSFWGKILSFILSLSFLTLSLSPPLDSLLFSALSPFHLPLHYKQLIILLTHNNDKIKTKNKVMLSFSLSQSTHGLAFVYNIVCRYETYEVVLNPMFESESSTDFWGRRWNILVHRGLKVRNGDGG